MTDIVNNPNPAGGTGDQPQLGPDGKPVVPNTPPEQKPGNAPEVKLELEETPAVAGLDAQPVTYDPTGNTGLDMALEFVGNLGFGPEHATMKAAEAGDFKPLREALGKLGDKAKGWEKFVKLGEEAYATQSGKAKEAEAATKALIINAVGDAETWEQVRAWAVGEATPEEKAEVNAAFKAGGRIAAMMARSLHEQWLKKADRSPAPAKAPNASANPGAVDVMTAAEYQKGVATLARKYNGDLEGKGYKEYEALQHRRIAAMKIGK